MKEALAHLWAFSALIAADAETSRLHPRHLQILGALCAEADPQSISALSAALKIDQPSLSRHALRLAGHGLISRQESPVDRRITLLSPTQQGRAINARVQSAYRAAAPAA